MKTLVWLLSLTLLVLSASCVALTPDLYVGDGVWRKGDGTTYQAEAPIRVEEVAVQRSRMHVSADPTGVKMLELEMTLAILLANGSTHEVWLSCKGRPGQRVYARGSFTASNQRRYSVSAGVVPYEYSAQADVTIRSLGPVRFQRVVDAF